MDHIEPRRTLVPARREATAEYILDMIDQMARLSRQIGDLHVAIHLEAIIAAQRAIAKGLSA